MELKPAPKACMMDTVTVTLWMAFPGEAASVESRVPSTGTSNPASWGMAQQDLQGAHQARVAQPGALNTKEKSICCLQLSVRNCGEDRGRLFLNLQIQLLTDIPAAYPGKGIPHWIGKALEHLAQEGCEISTSAGFSKLSRTWPWATWRGFEVRPALSRRLGTVTSRGPSNPNYSMMLWKNSRMNAGLPLEDVPSALRGTFEVDATAVFQIAALVLWTRRSQLPSIQQLSQTLQGNTKKAIFKRTKNH